jgi:hypothetical protein
LAQGVLEPAQLLGEIFNVLWAELQIGHRNLRLLKARSPRVGLVVAMPSGGDLE